MELWTFFSLSQFRSTSQLTFIVKGHGMGGMGGMGMETCQLQRDQGGQADVARSDDTPASPNNPKLHNWMFWKLLMIFMAQDKLDSSK